MAIGTSDGQPFQQRRLPTLAGLAIPVLGRGGALGWALRTETRASPSPPSRVLGFEGSWSSSISSQSSTPPLCKRLGTRQRRHRSNLESIALKISISDISAEDWAPGYPMSAVESPFSRATRVLDPSFFSDDDEEDLDAAMGGAELEHSISQLESDIDSTVGESKRQDRGLKHRLRRYGYGLEVLQEAERALLDALQSVPKAPGESDDRVMTFTIQDSILRLVLHRMSRYYDLGSYSEFCAMLSLNVSLKLTRKSR